MTSPQLRNLCLAMAVGLAGMAPRAASADEPLLAPERIRLCSPSGTFCAVSDPDAGETTLHEIQPDGSERMLWAIPGWHRQLAVSDQGALVTGYDGLNLVPRDYDPDTTMLAFHADGKTVARVSLSELFTDLDALEETTSHYYWGSYLGWNDAGHYRVETSEGRVLAFDPRTGARVKGDEAGGRSMWLYLALAAAAVAALVAVVRGRC